MNFKNWLLTEEIWQNNTATVYHRTRPERVSTILSTAWKTAGGCMYGCGLYTTFAIESQFTSYMEQYGTSIIKFKVTNLDQYIICHKSVAQQILGQNYKISDQLKKHNLSNLYDPKEIETFDQMMETVKFSSKIAKQMYEYNRALQQKTKGIIYYGENDGYCLVKYPPIEDGTITLLGYAYDIPSNDLNKMQELMSNCKKNEQGKCENPWTTSTEKISIKTLYGLKIEDKPQYLSGLTDEKFYALLRTQPDQLIEKRYKFSDTQFKFLLEKGRDQLIQKYIEKDNVLTDKQFELLVQKDKDNLLSLNIIKTYELTDKQFNLLLQKNKDHLIDIIIDIGFPIPSTQLKILLQKDKDKLIEKAIAKDISLDIDLLFQLEKYQFLGKMFDRGYTLNDQQFETLIKNKQYQILAKYIGTQKKWNHDLSDEQYKLFPNLDLSFFDLLDDYDIIRVIGKYDQPYKLMLKLGPDIINGIRDLYMLLNYGILHKSEIAKAIFQFKKNLNDQEVFLLIGSIDSLEDASKFISKAHLNKLGGTQVLHLINNTEKPEEMAKLLGPENLNKISQDDMSNFVKNNKKEKLNAIIKHVGTLPEEIIVYMTGAIEKLFINEKYNNDQLILNVIEHIKNLTPLSVANMLWFAYDKNKIADDLGEDNIKKLTDQHVEALLTNPIHSDEVRNQLKTILQKYGRL